MDFDYLSATNESQSFILRRPQMSCFYDIYNPTESRKIKHDM